MSFALIAALLAPLFGSLVNTLDKFIVSKRVRTPASFTVIAGAVNLMIGIIMAMCLDWSKYGFGSYVYAIIAGVIMGAEYYLYYYALRKEDASSVIGFIYFYPVMVSILSFLFLGELLSWTSYVGMALVLVGVMLLVIRLKRHHSKIKVAMIFSMIAVISLITFFAKLSTDILPEFNSAAVYSICVGLTIMLGLFSRKIRKGLKYEVRNFNWSMLVESLTVVAAVMSFFALGGLPATVVSVIAASQPLMVLFIETGMVKFGLIKSRDHKILPKLLSIMLIVVGIILMYSQEL
ncbi:MAG: EamA family transporter [Candidatus Woesearchaeota archaeon]